MYLHHFGLTHYPFERTLQSDELLTSGAAREAHARLSHLVELRGIGLITGEVGSGTLMPSPRTLDGRIRPFRAGIEYRSPKRI